MGLFTPFMIRTTILVGVTVTLCFILIDSAQDIFLGELSSFSSSRDGQGCVNDVKNQTLGMQQIFVISMPDRVDKHDHWGMAAKFTDITFEYIDGVVGDLMPLKAINPGWDIENEDGKTLGCFRAHVDAWSRMVHERIHSALIFEDDADWDVNIKSQLIELAKGVRYLQGDKGTRSHSPYGDDWDMLWIGHCGTRNRYDEDAKYYVIHNDPTVPYDRHRAGARRRRPWTAVEALQGNYTRIIYEPHHGLCASGYMLSLRGAEKLLWHFSLLPDAPVLDRALSKFCQQRLSHAKCYSPYPPLIGNYRAPGNSTRDSDRVPEHSMQKVHHRVKGQSDNLVFPMRPNIHKFIIENPIIPAQWKHDVLQRSIDLRSFSYPRGTEEFVTAEEFTRAAAAKAAPIPNNDPY